MILFHHKIFSGFLPVTARFLALSLLMIPVGFFPFEASAKTEPEEWTGRLWREIQQAGDDSIKIDRLFDLALFYTDYLNEEKLTDSLCRMAVRIAEMTHDPGLLFNAYNRFIEINNSNSTFPEQLGMGLKAGDILMDKTPDHEFRLAGNLAAIYLSAYLYDKALEYSYKCLSIATAEDNNTWRVKSYLMIGQSLEGRNHKIEAFRNYLNALSLSERIRNPELLYETYGRLSRFYNLSRMHSKAIHYKLLQQEIIRKKIPVDSVALVWTWYGLQEIDLNSDNNRLNEPTWNKILDFAERWQCKRLLEFETALIRSHLIEADSIRQLYDIYHNRFPLEMKKLETQNPGVHARLMAYFYEFGKKPDSAMYCFILAEKIYREHPNKILQSNFYSRFGEFLLRQGKTGQAIEKFSKAYDKAGEASFFDFMLSASRQLESIYAAKKDFENAYRYAVQNKILADSLAKMSKNDQLLVMEIEHEARQREINARQEKQEIDRRHYLQYTAIIIIIITVFIILLMLGSLKVPEWIIRMLGFFSFIFLFEFIILIADHKIHDLTHGEPWKILLIKIFLIAMLLPAHHWIEKRVIAFLLNPRLVNIATYPLRSKLRDHYRRIRK